MDKKPKIRQKKSMLLIAWIAPIVAIIISYAMIEDYMDQKGEIITITCDDVKGLNIRKSHIEYKGIQIGKILSIKPDPHNLQEFIIKAQIYKEYNYFIKKGSRFLIVEPSIEVQKVENIGTVLTGNYIELIPPTTNSYYLSKLPRQNIFKAVPTKPLQKGKILKLKGKMGNIDMGVKLTYKGVKIGEVTQKELSNKLVEYSLLVYEKYTHLLTKNSYFYVVNPVEIDISKDRFNFELAPFKDMVFGSIALIEDKNLQKDNTLLYGSKNELLLKQDNIFTIIIQSDFIKNNEKIYYKGSEIGYVKDIYHKNHIQYAKVYIKKEYRNYITNNTKFYKVNSVEADISLEGIKLQTSSIQEILFGGIALEFQKGEFQKDTIYKLYESKQAIKDELDKLNNFTISILMDDLGNIKKTSKLFYKNIPIGSIKDIQLKNNKVEVVVSIPNKYRSFFGNDAKIYLEGAQVSLSKIKNVSHAILGDKLVLLPSKSKATLKKYFLLDSINPIDTIYKDGKRITLKAKDAKNIAINTPILYKYVEIGKVEKITLDTNDDSVKITVFIENIYAKYINDGTFFYLDKTIDAKFSLFDSSVEIGSMKTFLQGGINIDFISNLEDKEFKNKNKDGFFILLSNNPKGE